MSLAKHQKFEVKRVHRSELKNAPYNPRTIGAKQKAGLKKNIKKVGLIDPLIWNETTGNLVKGHRRIEIMDEVEKTDDYEMDVAVVRLDEKTEKEQNIFLNSTTYAGEFDLEALAIMIESGEIDPNESGLDETDLNIIGINFDEAPEEMEGSEVFDDIAAQKKEENIALIKQRKAESRQEIDARFEEGERYVTLSFSSYAAKSSFMRDFGLSSDDLYIKGEVFLNIIKEKMP